MKRAIRFKRLTALALSALMLTGSFAAGGVMPASAATGTGSSAEDIKADLNTQSYTSYYEGVIAEGATLSQAAKDYLGQAGNSGMYKIPVDITKYETSGTNESDPASSVADLIVRLEDALAVETMKQEKEKLAERIKASKGALLASDALYLPEVGSVTFEIEISEEQAGLYSIMMQYYAISGSTSAVERMLYIDGKVPFAQSRALSMSKQWEYKYAEDADGNPLLDKDGNPTFKTDLQGNHVRASIQQVYGWRTYECSDSDGFVNHPFEFYFTPGTHTITLRGVREGLIIRSLMLVADSYTANNWVDEDGEIRKNEYTYEQYLKDVDAANKNRPSTQKLHMQAETPYRVSDSSVYAAADRSSAITEPSRPDAQLLNTLGKSSYDTIGQWASYQFTVAEEGMYQIVMRYKQTALEGMFVSRSLLLWSDDGQYGYWFPVATAAEADTYAYKIEQADGTYLVSDGTPTNPFSEAKNLRFNYSKDWVSAAVTDGAHDYFEFLFKDGVNYTMTLAVSLGELSDILNAIETSLKEINQCYLNILQLTGPDPDEYRDYKFGRVMPATVRNLLRQSKALEKQAEALEKACDSKGSNTATLKNISRLLGNMGRDEDEIAPNLENLKSYIGTLGTWINSARRQGVMMDFVVVQSSSDSLPASNANFFVSIWNEIKAFFASFYVDYDSMGVMADVEFVTTIDVWLAYGRDQSQIWKTLIDNYFTSESGIAVNLKLVAAGTLLPSVLAGQGPDAYIGETSANVINYAIRGAIINIEGREGYNEVLGYDEYREGPNGTYEYYKDGKLVDPNTISFNAACMIPISLYGKTYGLPEQANVPMMFYRQDIMAELGLDIPETWDDILSAIPVLQANNMMIGLQYESAINMFLYQYGSSLWKYEDDMEYAGAQINLDDPKALESFTFCTRLYTDYSFPFAYDGPNRFRTGEMPILIADYVTTYNQLVVFATEIKNLWSFTSLPGYYDKTTKSVNNQSVVTVTATVMLTGCSDEESTWTYMKWQADGEMQGQYGNEMVALVGPAAKYSTANINGIKNLSWTATEYASLMAQFQNLAAIPNYPGSYIIARYTKFAFLAAYNDHEDPTDAMESYIAIINQELTRKREEFGNKTLDVGQTPEDVRGESAKGEQ